jgi:hypothetical protein
MKLALLNLKVRSMITLCVAVFVAWAFSWAALDDFHDSFYDLKADSSSAFSIEYELFSSDTIQMESSALSIGRKIARITRVRFIERQNYLIRLMSFSGLSYHIAVSNEPGEKLFSPDLPTPVKRLI